MMRFNFGRELRIINNYIFLELPYDSARLLTRAFYALNFGLASGDASQRYASSIECVILVYRN